MFTELSAHELFMLERKLMSAYDRSAGEYIRNADRLSDRDRVASGQRMWDEIADLLNNIAVLV